ncbi:MAG: DUF308 domain-containing protein [Oscillospiraceae bacterium]|nr:DUF308 domain-containing protein [Oscillospiraceae bacterium]
MRTVRSVLPMQTAKAGYIVISLLMGLFGVFLFCQPDVSTAAVGDLAGILLVIFGIFKLIGYFSKDLYRLAFQFDLAFGCLLVILGIVILTKPQNLLHFLCVVTGLYVTADGLMKLQTAHDAQRFGIGSWWVLLAAALLTAGAGILLLVRPAQSVRILTQIFGIVLAAEGLLNLLTVLMTVKIVRHQKPDIIEVGYEEEMQK